MNINNPNAGVFLGRTTGQTHAKIGGIKDVFVKLQGQKNELVGYTGGAYIMNPFKNTAKFYAGDLFEYRTDDNGLNPKLYLLKTFKVYSQGGIGSETTVNIYRDGYLHIPFVGDVLMKAPTKIGGSGAAYAITAVSTTTISGVDVWQLTFATTLGTLAKNDILVEAEEAGPSKAMLVKNINAVAPTDGDNYGVSAVVTDEDDFEGNRQLYTPAIGGVMYINKMSPMPKCVLDLNESKVNGWFKIQF